LDPVGINQKYRFMSLESGRRASGRIVRILPITDKVIQRRVNELGTEQKQPVVHDGRLLFEWKPGFPIENDAHFYADDPPSDNDSEGGEEEVLQEPVDEVEGDF